jgi:hypothetical protein
MTQISNHDEICSTGHRKFDQMVVGFIRQIRTPRILDTRPFAAGDKYIEQFVSFGSIQPTIHKQIVAPAYILVFVEERVPHQRCALRLQACFYYGFGGTRAKTSTKKNICIGYDPHVTCEAFLPPHFNTRYQDKPRQSGWGALDSVIGNQPDRMGAGWLSLRAWRGKSESVGRTVGRLDTVHQKES